MKNREKYNKKPVKFWKIGTISMVFIFLKIYFEERRGKKSVQIPIRIKKKKRFIDLKEFVNKVKSGNIEDGDIKILEKLFHKLYKLHKKNKRKVVAFCFSTVVVAVTIGLITSFIFPAIFKSNAASYTWLQSSWSGGATANYPTHEANQSGWTQYGAADANITAGGDISVSTTSSSSVQTNDTQLNAGTLLDTQVNNVGSSANVSLNTTSLLDWGENSYVSTYNTTGKSYGVFISGNYAYIADNTSGLQIINISTPSTPTLAGTYNTTGNAYEVFVSGNYAYVADNTSGLQIINISTPSTPTLTGTYNTTGNARDVYVSGNYAYVADYDSGLQIIDISTPASPTLTGTYDTTGSAYGVFVSGNYAYVADYTSGLQIIDISTPASPTLTGTYDTTGSAYAVFVAGNYAYVADFTSGLQIIDISTPSTPTLTSTCKAAGLAWEEISVVGDYAYIANGTYGFSIVNVSNPASPALVGVYDTSDYVHEVFVSGNYGYVADDDNGIHVLNINNPENVSLKASYNTPSVSHEVFYSGNYVYVADESSGLQIIDISTPSTPTLAGTYDTTGYAYGVFVSGNYAYVADYDYGLQIIDISIPSTPTLAGTYDTAGRAYGVFVSGNYAYVADYDYGLQIIDISTPSTPTLAGTYDTTGSTYGVFVSDNYVYVADNTSGLQIIDISTPSTPTLAGTYNTPGFARGIFVSGNYAYVADGSMSGLQIIDITTPATPTLAGTYDTMGDPRRVFVSGSYAYVADSNYGLQVINISNPANLLLVAVYPTSNTTNGTYASGAYAYMADGTSGLQILSSGSYLGSGTYTSSAIDTEQNNQAWGNVSWNANVPASTQMVLKAKTSSSSSIDNVNSCDQLALITSANQTGSVALSGNNCITVGERYIKYYLEFSSSDSNYSPALNDITINFTYYPTERTITSSAYNGSSVVNVIGSLQWSETRPSGTDVKFQIRTATNNAGSPGTWTDWLGPTGTGDYYTDPNGLETINSAHSDGVGDDWFQYKVWLSTNNVSAPTVDDIAFNYAANVAPTIQNVTASQNANGAVTISYEVKDVDTTTGTNTPNEVTPSFEYWNGLAYLPCATMASGDTDNKAVLEGSLSFYSATWTAATDFANQFMNNTAKIRVTVDDNEFANSFASSESATFTLDTKAPAKTGFSADATTTPATITISATDDSSFEMKTSLLGDLLGASWVSYQATSTITFATNPDTVYAQLKDVFSNTTSIFNVTIPLSPQNIIIRDVTNIDTSDYQLFIAWEESLLAVPDFKEYKIYKSNDGENYALVSTLTDKTINYYMSPNLTEGTTYYYKVTTEDNDDNVSYFSDIVSDAPNGQGGTDATAPAISSVSSSSITATQATITWTTDELSNSLVGYSTTQGVFTSETSVSTMTTSHSVVLIGLAPSTTYYYQVKSTDPSTNTATDNNTGNGYTFTTTQGAVITPGSVTASRVENTSATIEWLTDINSDSYVVYSTNSDLSGSTQTGSATLATIHSVTLSGLTQWTRYYYYVKSTDGESNLAVDNNGGDYYYFTTTTDSTAPTITFDSNTGITNITWSSTLISWTTNEPAVSTVSYGLTANSYTFTETESNYNYNHAITISGLSNSTTYYFKISSADANSNTATNDNSGSDYSFTTLDSGSPTISDVSSGNTTLTGAQVIWTTNESSDSFVQYADNTGTFADDYVEVGSSENITSHIVNITWLSEYTTYYYLVKSTDSSGNLTTDDNGGAYYSFITERDETAPTITNITATSIMDTSAVITWTTNECATSQAEYGTSSGSYSASTTENTNSNINHAVSLSGLTANTQYYYRVISKDVSNNQTTSSEQTFTTLETLSEASEVRAVTSGGGGIIVIDKTDKDAPIINDIKIKDVKADSATILWTTNEDANSFVEYNSKANSDDYQTSGIYDKVKNHSVTLKRLDSDTMYYYTVLSADGWGNLAKDENHSFETISKAAEDLTFEEAIEKLQMTDQEESSEEEEEEPALFQGEGERNASQENSASNNKESIFLSAAEQVLDIIQRTASQVSIGVLESTLARQYEAISEISEIIPPPLMSSEPLVTTMADSATITWTTDKETNSLVAFSPHSSYNPKEENPYKQMTGSPEELATNHSVRLYNLTADTVYHYQIISKAPVGPEARSKDFTFKTNSEVLEIINYTVETLSHQEAIFRWTTNIETDAAVKYIPYRNNNPIIDEIKIKNIGIFSLEHEIAIDDFSSGMFYDIELSGKDKKGHIVTKEIKAFKTGQDDLPPLIYQVKTESAISQGKDVKAQTIVSWLTNEPSTTRIYYDKGVGSELDKFSSKTALDENYTKKHVVIITKFEPGMVYRFKAESIDYSGNAASSKVFSILVPRQQESIFQIIMKTMEKTFGWVKKI